MSAAHEPKNGPRPDGIGARKRLAKNPNKNEARDVVRVVRRTSVPVTDARAKSMRGRTAMWRAWIGSAPKTRIRAEDSQISPQWYHVWGSGPISNPDGAYNDSVPVVARSRARTE